MKKKSIFSTLLLFFYFLFIHFSSWAQQNIWVQKANFLGVAREQIVSFSIGAKGYVGLGRDANNNYKNDFWEYNPSSDAWSQKANFSGSGVYAAKGFSIGTEGYIGVGSSAMGGGFTNEFWEYNPSSNTWTQKANYPGQGRWGCTGFSIGSKGYLGLGWQGGTFNDFWEYNPASNTWTQKASYSGGTRSDAIGFGINTKGYVGLGNTSASNNGTNDFWEYDPSSNTWSQKANYGGGMRPLGAVGFNIGTKGYAGLGLDNNNNLYNDFWEYDPSTNTWTQRANYSGTSRHYAAGFGIDYKGYLGLGWTGQQNVFANDFWEYTPSLLYTSPLVINSYCTGSALTVSYTSSGVNFINGNIFTAQLSNASGSFASPVDIGTLTSTATSGNINATIPTNTSSGSAYRIRVVSSNPAITGSDNGTNITINSLLPTITITSQKISGSGEPTIYRFTATSIQGVTYDWYYGAVLQQSGPSNIFEAYFPCNVSKAVYCTITNFCGTVTSNTITKTGGCERTYNYILSPNPTSTTITVTQDQKNKNLKITHQANATITEIRIYDNVGNLKKQLNYGTGTRQVRINVSDLKTGIYYVEVSNGQRKERQQIIIQKN
ncbi:MAG TPA: kelch repeat-containing protein [Chitinophagaceae bacterium]